MAQVRFGMFTLSVYHPKSRATLPLNDVGGGRTFYEVALAALRTRETAALVKERTDGTGKATQFSRLDGDSSKRVIHGVGRHGGYGQGSTLLNVVTSATTPREPVQADLLPHYFYLDASGDSKEAILLVQVVKGGSLRAPIYELLRDGLRGVEETLQLRIEGCIPGDVLRELAKDNTVKTIEVGKRHVPQDRVDSGVQAAQVGNLKLTYTVKGGLGRGWKTRLGIGAGSRPARAVFVPADGLSEFEDYDSLKVHVKVGSSTKTVDLMALGNPQPYLLPDQTKIGYGADGNPLIEDIHLLAVEEVEEMRKILDDLA